MAKRRISVIKALFKAFKDGATITAACKAAGIGRTIYFRWCIDWPDFEKRCLAYQNKARIPLVKDALYAQAMQGNVPGAKLWLEHQGIRVDVPPPPPPPAIAVAAPEVHVHLENKTEFNLPVANTEERDRLIANAQLIRKHRLIDRTLGPEGSQPLLGVLPEGQQRAESDAGGDTSRDSVAHSGVQAPE